MKKLIVFLCCVAILCSIGVAAFADYDLSGMTDDELSELQKAVEAEIRSRKTTQNSDAGETFEAMVYSGSGDKVLMYLEFPETLGVIISALSHMMHKVKNLGPSLTQQKFIMELCLRRNKRLQLWK